MALVNTIRIQVHAQLCAEQTFVGTYLKRNRNLGSDECGHAPEEAVRRHGGRRASYVRVHNVCERT